MFATLDALFKKVKKWFEEDIPTDRSSNDQDGRKWFAKSIDYTKTFKLADLRSICDRSKLNSDYKTRFNEKTVKSRKGVSAIKQEISAMYSFQKCFVLRHKSRLQYYKDDLSQKRARNMYCVWQSYAIMKEFKKNLDS